MKNAIRILAVLLPLTSWAATTTVSQHVVNPDGTDASGTAFIRITAACKSGATYVGDKTVAVKFTGGAFSVSLVPNDTCVPAGTSYTVSWALNGGKQWAETWLVYTSGTPLTVDDVVITTTPLPTWLVQWPQIAQGGAATGQAPVWNGSSWTPGYVTGTGAAWGTITGPLSNQTDLANALAGKVGTSDSRLTDARTPLAHVHLIADVTGLQLALDLKAPLASPVFTGTVDAHGATKTLPHRTGQGSPVSRDACSTIGETYFQSDATAGSNTFACTAAGSPGVWSLQGGGGGGTWGTITGTLASQADLATALNGKQATISGAPGTWPTLGTAAAHAAGDFQAPIVGAPSTWPTTSYAFNFSANTYSTGTVDVTNGSNAIVGHGTTWTAGMTGMLFITQLANCHQGYKFTYVDATHGTLETTYGTGSDSGHPCPAQSNTGYLLSDIVSVAAATHQLGTADISIQCFDANTPRNRLVGSAFAAGPSVDPTTYAVQIVFWSTQAGRCILQR